MKVKEAQTMSKRSMRRVRIMIHKRMKMKMMTMTIICTENMMRRLIMETKKQVKMRVKSKGTRMRINRKNLSKMIINHIMGMNNLNKKMNKKTKKSSQGKNQLKKSKKKMNRTKNMDKRNNIISLRILPTITLFKGEGLQ
jgi:hypothetical protein